MGVPADCEEDDLPLASRGRFYHEICMIKGSFVYYEEKREALSVW